MTDYKPGSFFLSRVSGKVGFLIGIGQALAGEPSRYGHAGIIIDADGSTVEAQPGGAIRGNVSNYYGRPFLVSDGPVQMWLEANPGGDEQAKRTELVRIAVGDIGTPYSAIDYFALAALHLGLPSVAIRRYVQSSGHRICSQEVDAVYQRGSIRLFDDDRLPGDVMPADLAAWAEDWAAHQASLVVPA